MRCEPILDGGAALGVVMHLDAGSDPRSRPLLGLGSLTDTERSVANLVAEGLTNRQIAERVFISRHTVDFHLRSIFRKVGVASRVELARQVIGASRDRLARRHALRRGPVHRRRAGEDPIDLGQILR